MNIMGSSGSEHEDESAEWRRSARCTSANAIILGASFALSIRGRLRLHCQRRHLHSLLSRAAYLSFARQSPSQTSRGAAESKLFGLCPTGQSYDRFQSRLRDHKNRSSTFLPIDRVAAAGGPQWVDVKHASSADSLRDRSL